MKKLLLLFTLLPLLVVAQEKSADSTDKKNIRVISFGGYIGSDAYGKGGRDVTLFQQAAPFSALAFADLNGYSAHRARSLNQFYSQTSVSKGINVHLQLPCQQKYAELRFGLSHSKMNIADQYYSGLRVTALNSDTLSNGSVLYTDSISNSTYVYSWSADVIHLHVGWIVRTDPRRWFNLYSGVGLFGGIGFNGSFFSAKFQSSYHHTYDAQHQTQYYTHSQTDEIVTEQLRAPSLSSMGAYIPIGLNLRLGRRRDLPSHLTLFGEYNGGIQFMNPKGTDSIFRTVSSLYGGVRWYINDPGTIDRPKK